MSPRRASDSGPHTLFQAYMHVNCLVLLFLLLLFSCRNYTRDETLTIPRSFMDIRRRTAGKLKIKLYIAMKVHS